MYILPEDGDRSGPKHVVSTKTLLRTVVLRKALVDTRATECKTQQLKNESICLDTTIKKRNTMEK
jgi:hypothetical protein